jgi:hypothetical protein
MTRTITIYGAGNGWCVHEGERHSGPLSWDEMLGQIASLTLPFERHSLLNGLFGMKTPEEWQDRRERGRRNWVSPISRELGPMTLEALRVFAHEHGSRAGEFDELLPWYMQGDTRVRLALMLLDACKAPDSNTVNVEVPHA